MKFNNIKSVARRLINKILKGTHDHYFCRLPENIGFLSNFLLRIFYSGITVSPEQTKNLNHLKKNGIIVYAVKHKSYFNYLFYYTRYKQDKFPFPQIGFDYNILIWQPISRIFKIFLSNLDYFFHNFALPDPYKGDFIKNSLLNGEAAFLSLVENF